jgi:hypothetical protein
MSVCVCRLLKYLVTNRKNYQQHIIEVILLKVAHILQFICVFSGLIVHTFSSHKVD